MRGFPIAWGTRAVLCAGLLLAPLCAQERLAVLGPTVSVAPPERVTLVKGRAGRVTLQFRVAPGFHINSNTPKSEYLIPTALKVEPAGKITVAKIVYPEGADMSFAFAPEEKINVYTGDFAVEMTLKATSTAAPGSYKLHGLLRYQACDNAACYPPKKLPIEVDVLVGSSR